MTYELNLKQYSGPLDKLLELIEARKLEITEISLAEVTEDFLKYLEELKGKNVDAEHMGILADFIVIASRLLFIKSKSLLPELTLTSEEEAEIKDLETRLKMYKALRPALTLLQALWREGNREWSRPYLFHVKGTAVFYPAPSISPENLATSLKRIFETFEKLALETQVVREKIITLEEKIEEIIEQFKKLTEASFRGISKSKSKTEIIVTFLALLHLAREQMIFLEQEGHLSDIIIKKQHAK